MEPLEPFNGMTRDELLGQCRRLARKANYLDERRAGAEIRRDHWFKEREKELDENERLRKENERQRDNTLQLEEALEEDSHMQADAYRQAVAEIDPYVGAGKLPNSLVEALPVLLEAFDKLEGTGEMSDVQQLEALLRRREREMAHKDARIAELEQTIAEGEPPRGRYCYVADKRRKIAQGKLDHLVSAAECNYPDVENMRDDEAKETLINLCKMILGDQAYG